MLKLLVILLILSILVNLALFLKALDYRKKMIMAWAQTHHWVEQYSNAERAEVQQDQTTEMVLIGSSITAHWDLSRFFPSRRFRNAGIDGQYSGQLLLRFKHDVLDVKPEAVLIKLCEMNFSHEIPETVTMDNMIMMATLAQANGIRPYIATTIPVCRQIKSESMASAIINSRIKAFNEGLRAYARQQNWPLVDLAAAMSDPQGYLFDRMAVDGIHPSEEGYRIMTQVLEKTLTE
jgi:lysophospholipase L1-like esterase